MWWKVKRDDGRDFWLNSEKLIGIMPGHSSGSVLVFEGGYKAQAAHDPEKLAELLGQVEILESVEREE